MTLSQLIAHALRQLDEDAEDVSEYEESFKVYANMGYDIAVREYLKPRRTFCVDVDEKGNAPVPGMLVTRVVELRDEYGRDVGYTEILKALANFKYKAVMAVFYGALIAGGAEMDWETFDNLFKLDSIEGIREIIVQGVVDALPKDSGGNENP